MSEKTILWVYAVVDAIERDKISVEAVDGGNEFASTSTGNLTAVYSFVDADEFSQEEIDRRANDLQWLGSIGYRHQAVVAALAKSGTVIPLRAFTLFSSEDSLQRFLTEQSDDLRHLLERLEGKDEWTLRIEFQADQWADALERRVDQLKEIVKEKAASSGGKAYLLTKKLEEEKKKAAREAELSVVSDIERAVAEELKAPTIVEGRQKRAGSFPQVNILLDRAHSQDLRRLHDRLAGELRPDGVLLVLTGPWPPYTFASEGTDGG